MKSGIKKRWLKALRSDEYVQGNGQLCRENSKHDYFCCLGVLCDVLGEEFTEDPRPGMSKTLGVNINGEGITSYTLPDRLMAKAGLSWKEHRQLWWMNDGGGDQKRCSFIEIANWIEAKL